MATDTVDIRTDVFYKSAGQNNNNSHVVSEMVAGLIAAFGGTSTAMDPTGHFTIGDRNTTTFTSGGYPNIDNLKNTDPNLNAGKPKAYMNWILFDEQFNMVGSSSGTRQINSNADAKGTMAELGKIMNTNGYLYVYLSNEGPMDVYFDNFQVTHHRGRMLEETHYYPFGLVMSGISSRALNNAPENKRKWNAGSELASKEFSDGSGLELYETFYRSLDPQLGRFWQIDPKPNLSMSLYASMENNPIRFNDPLGDTLLIRYKKHDIVYNNGVLTNKDGSAYTGKVKGFLKQTVNALNTGRTKSAEANGIVGELQGSKNNFTIVKGNTNKTDYNSSQRLAAYANQIKTDPAQAGVLAGTTPAQLAGGSGSTITWNPNGDNVWVVGGGQDNNPTINLFHELGHALDDNRGQRDDRVPDPLYPKIDRSEWQATVSSPIFRTTVN